MTVNTNQEWLELATAPTTPTAASGKWKLYPKSDGWYYLDDTGAETKFASATGFLPAANPTATGKATVDQLALAASTELTIASGAVTASAKSFFRIDTQADAASDDLDTINGGAEGILLILRAENTARTVVVTNAGNILTPNGVSISLDDTSKFLLLIYDATLSNWAVVGFASLADVVGPASATDNALASFDDTTGKLLKSSGVTLVGDVITMPDSELIRPKLRDYSETANVVAASGSTETLDFTVANYHKVTLTDDCTLTFSNPPASGSLGSLTVKLIQDGTGGWVVTFPASVEWANGVAPTPSTGPGEVDIFVFITDDGGTTYQGGTFGLNFS